jgi:hypothetical protein
MGNIETVLSSSIAAVFFAAFIFEQENMNVAKFSAELCCLEVRIFKFYLDYC